MGTESYNVGCFFVKDLYTYISQIQQKNKILEANKWALIWVKTIVWWLTFYPCKFPRSTILHRWVLYLEILSSPVKLNICYCKRTDSGQPGKAIAFLSWKLSQRAPPGTAERYLLAQHGWICSEVALLLQVTITQCDIHATLHHKKLSWGS